MRRKVNKNKEVGMRETGPEKACVGGSIPSLGTILNIPDHVESLEIHGDWDVIPALSYVNGKPYHYRVLRKNLNKRCDKGVTSKRRRKSA